MNAKKKILIYAHYYTPDVASTAQVIKDLAEGLLDAFEVTVICTVPSYTGKIEEKYKAKKYYKENINGVYVLRIRVPEFQKNSKKSRIKNIVSYFFGAIGATFKAGKQDIVFSISQPPILGGLIGVIGKWLKHAKFVYNIQDFNPEQTIAVGYSKNKTILNLMMKLDKFSCKKSNLIITVGRDLVETVNNRFKNKKTPKTVFINNWIDEKQVYPLPEDDKNVANFKKKYGLENKYIIMYSGNIGLYYDLENILKVIEKIKPGTKTGGGKEVVFAFVGEGTILNDLKEYKNRYGMDNVIFIPYQDKEELIYSLNAADVHLCVNAKGIKGVSCPSKYYGIAAVQKPIIGVLEEGSEVRLLIEETKGGLVSSPEDYEAIEKNIRWFIENSSSKELQEMGKRSRAYLENNLTKDISVLRYKEECLKLLK